MKEESFKKILELCNALDEKKKRKRKKHRRSIVVGYPYLGHYTNDDNDNDFGDSDGGDGGGE